MLNPSVHKRLNSVDLTRGYSSTTMALTNILASKDFISWVKVLVYELFIRSLSTFKPTVFFVSFHLLNRFLSPLSTPLIIITINLNKLIIVRSCE